MFNIHITLKKKKTFGFERTMGPVRVAAEILLDLSLSEPQRLPAGASAIQLRCRCTAAGRMEGWAT